MNKRPWLWQRAAQTQQFIETLRPEHEEHKEEDYIKQGVRRRHQEKIDQEDEDFDGRYDLPDSL